LIVITSSATCCPDCVGELRHTMRFPSRHRNLGKPRVGYIGEVAAVLTCPRMLYHSQS
jgi:hypothetical protein